MSSGHPGESLVARIREHWNQQAREHGDASTATMPDGLLKELEIAAILNHLEGHRRVLDLGCGNGFSTVCFADSRPGSYVGIDFSVEMIAVARARLAGRTFPAATSVEFRVGDATRLDEPDASFDVVTTDRCLINLPDPEYQRQALREIHRVLKPKGTYLMCEDTHQGLARLNQLRTLADLPVIGTRWHNVYLDEDALATTWSSLFDLETVDHFSSLYYIASRIFNARLAQDQHVEPSYDHPINHLAARLPSVGDYGPLKLFVFRRR